MRQLLKENRFFFIPYIFTLIICVVLLLTFSKPELHILSNKANSIFFDYFFKYVTNLGDGVIIAILTIILLFIKYRYAIVFLSGSLLTAGIINLIKKVLLGEVFRPSKYFEIYETYQLHFVEGVKLNALQSFPSGHTGTAFNLFFMLALISPGKWLKLFWFFMAAVVGYSRVYLSQHFLIDITVGSIIGVTIILFMFFLMSKPEKVWLDKSLIRRK
ncbi:MAG: phosphatase PAP2 family protein [Draconibacterium sp.]|nr:phosphatase PAP2 family protein [Draconibacterium sp.]